MVERLKSRDIRNISVLNAMNEVPRHFFLDSAFLEFAYKDNAFPIGCDQTISNPYTVASETLVISLIFRNSDPPRIAQLTAISGRKIPKEL